MVEDTRLVSSRSDGEEQEVETLAQVKKAENVRMIASDVKKGELVMKKGEIISAKGGEIGTLVFVGRKEVIDDVFLNQEIANFGSGRRIQETDCRTYEHGK
jgi:gephyrin